MYERVKPGVFSQFAARSRCAQGGGVAVRVRGRDAVAKSTGSGGGCVSGVRGRALVASARLRNWQTRRVERASGGLGHRVGAVSGVSHVGMPRAWTGRESAASGSRRGSRLRSRARACHGRVGGVSTCAGRGGGVSVRGVSVCVRVCVCGGLLRGGACASAPRVRRHARTNAASTFSGAKHSVAVEMCRRGMVGWDQTVRRA